jgi:hypothetical protein
MIEHCWTDRAQCGNRLEQRRPVTLYRVHLPLASGTAAYFSFGYVRRMPRCKGTLHTTSNDF